MDVMVVLAVVDFADGVHKCAMLGHMLLDSVAMPMALPREWARL